MSETIEETEATQAGAKPGPNPQQAKQHLNLLVAGWGEDEWLELRAIDPAKKAAPLCSFFTPTQTADAVDWALALNIKGRNLYAGVHARTRKSKAGTDAHVAQARYLMGDLDSQEQVDRCRGVLPSPTFWICTGTVPSLRGQPYWRLDQPLPVANGYKELMEGIRSVAESDDIGNPSRIMRLAGMISWPAPH